MRRFQFLHAADLHLDTPFTGLSRLDAEIGARLRNASLDAYDALIALALERRVAFVLFSGDIFDGADRGVRAQLRFRNGLQRLNDAGIRAFVIYGNHDPLNGWTAIREMPPLVKEFAGNEMRAVDVEQDGEVLATVHGISYQTRETTENLSLGFNGASNGALQIGLLHANVGGSSEHGNYSPCTMADLRNRGIDYWALGHIHKREILSQQHPCVVYPGCLQGRSPKVSEQEAKGVYVVTAEGRQIVELEFVPLDQARFTSYAVDISGVPDIPGLVEQLQAMAAEKQASEAGRGILARVTLVGRGEVHADLQRVGAISAMLQELRERAPIGSAFFWWDQIDDQTNGALDFNELRKRDDFLAEILRTADRFRDDGASREEWFVHVLGAVNAGQVGQVFKFANPGKVNNDALLQRATARAIELLDRGNSGQS